MTDKDTPTPKVSEEVLNRIIKLDATANPMCAEHAMEDDDMEQLALLSNNGPAMARELLALRQQLAELEQKRREDVRKCDAICGVIARQKHDAGMTALKNGCAGVASNRASDADTAIEVAQAIRAAFPDVFKESSNG